MNKSSQKLLALLAAATIATTAAVPTFAASFPKIGGNSVSTSASTASANGYYASKLSASDKKAYAAILDGARNFKTTINLPNKLSDSARKNVWNYLMMDDPTLFYINPSSCTFKSTSDGKNTVQMSYDSTKKNQVSQVKSKVNSILQKAPKSGTDYDKELFCHDYLVNNVQYNLGQKTPYNSLIEGKGNCMGYSYAMKLLLDGLGVKNHLMMGSVKGNEHHMWIVVTLNGKDYTTDVTWDDPNNGSPNYRYFNLDKTTMGKTHTPDDASAWASCTNTDMDYYKKNGLYFNNTKEVEAALPELMKNNPDYIWIKLPSQSQAEKTADELWNTSNTGALNKYTNSISQSNADEGVIRIDLK